MFVLLLCFGQVILFASSQSDFDNAITMKVHNLSVPTQVQSLHGQYSATTEYSSQQQQQLPTFNQIQRSQVMPFEEENPAHLSSLTSHLYRLSMSRTISPSTLTDERLKRSATQQVENEPLTFSENSRGKNSVVGSTTIPNDKMSNRNQYAGTGAEKACEEREVFFQSKCHELLKQGPCAPNQWLVEIEGKGTCKNTTCHYPEIPFNGRCLDDNKLRYAQYQNCPDGMTITVSRDGTVGCDCLAEHIYDPQNDKCYEAYTKGPCRYAQYFVLVQNGTTDQQSVATKCITNPCRLNNYVLVFLDNNISTSTPTSTTNKKGICVKMKDPCNNGAGRYQVDAKTLQVTCIDLSNLTSDGKTIANVPSFACATGSKRDVNGVCRKTASFNFS